MKIYISILVAVVSFFSASRQTEKESLSLDGIYGYYLEECTDNNGLPSEALAAECNFSLQHTPEGKQGGHTFSKHNIKQSETTNKCGQHLHSISLLHNSLPAITASHRHIFLLGRLII